MKASDTQVGGSHYKMKIQPLDKILFGHMHPIELKIVKYISRYPNKNGKEDLNKTLHYLDFLEQRMREHRIYFYFDFLLTKISRIFMRVFRCYISMNEFIIENNDNLNYMQKLCLIQLYKHGISNLKSIANLKCYVRYTIGLYEEGILK